MTIYGTCRNLSITKDVDVEFNCSSPFLTTITYHARILLLQDFQRKDMKVSAGNRKARYTVTEVREMRPDNSRELKAYFKFLTDPQNLPHFAAVPKKLKKFRSALKKTGIHPLIAINGLQEIVGAVTIRDADPDEHDHWLSWGVVATDLQERGIGKQMIIRAIDVAFSTHTHDRRERLKLDVGVNVGVPGWIRMVALLLSLDFQVRMWLPEEITVEMNGTPVILDTIRLELLRKNWKKKII